MFQVGRNSNVGNLIPLLHQSPFLPVRTTFPKFYKTSSSRVKTGIFGQTMARIRLQLVHIPLLTRLFRPQTVSRPFRTGSNCYVQRFQTVLVRLQPVQVSFVTSSISFPLRPLSSITRPPHLQTDHLDHSTSSFCPQYVQILTARTSWSDI